MTQMSERSFSAGLTAGLPDLEQAIRLLDCARQARSLHRANFDGTEPDVVRLEEPAATELFGRLAARVERDIWQIVPYAGQRRSAETFGDLVWRNLASGGRRIRRLYLVPAGEERSGRLATMLT